MRSTNSLTRSRLFLLSATLLCLPGCVGMGYTNAILGAWDCHKLIPEEVKQKCLAAPLPSPSATDPQTGAATTSQVELDQFADGQTAALDKCDANRQLAIDVSAECRAQQIAAQKALEERFKKNRFP